jgi:hypothetical protein
LGTHPQGCVLFRYLTLKGLRCHRTVSLGSPAAPGQQEFVDEMHKSLTAGVYIQETSAYEFKPSPALALLSL